MRIEIIKKIICNKCQSNFNLSKINKIEKNNVICGLVTCKCSTKPIVESILFLEPSQKIPCDKINEIILISKNYERNKLLELIMGGLYGHIDSNYNNYIRRCFLQDELYYYNRNRTSTKSFFHITPFFSILNNLVLDVGCSIGMLTRIMTLINPQLEIIGLEDNIKTLFAASKFFKLKDLICSNINKGIPFKKKQIDFCIASDMFHYVNKKEFVAKEFIRTSKNIIIPHLHTNFETMNEGQPLTIQEYEQIFPNCLIIPSFETIKNYLEKEIINLNKI
ncbi:hypothetical protein CMO90_04020 [Candidatus Woesearchaeota archaeon]|jgi:SAM-dependent methyltransferase|nr:hypothetical protein [Candidatus Woesearchaeota archaeon]